MGTVAVQRQFLGLDKEALGKYGSQIAVSAMR